MNPNIVAALISTGGTTLIAIIAIVQNSRNLDHIRLWLEAEFKRIDERFAYIEKRLDSIDNRVAKLEEASHSPIVRG